MKGEICNMKWPSKEAQVVVLCSRIVMSSEQREQVIQLTSSSDFNWTELLNFIMQHKLSGLVAKHLENISTLPVGVSKILNNLAAFNREKGRLYTLETEKLFQEFNEKKIKAVLFKGPRLLNDIYKDYSLRTFSDLDILISPRDYPPEFDSKSAFLGI